MRLYNQFNVVFNVIPLFHMEEGNLIHVRYLTKYVSDTLLKLKIHDKSKICRVSLQSISESHLFVEANVVKLQSYLCS